MQVSPPDDMRQYTYKLKKIVKMTESRTALCDLTKKRALINFRRESISGASVDAGIMHRHVDAI